MFALVVALLIGFVLGGAPPAPRPASDLERLAVAVEGAESSHGNDPRMWRANPDGPQGPMQVSRAAAADIGGGDRFDPVDNRRIGQAYLGLMVARYGDWSDAVTAYAWGPGNFDRWVAAGRPPSALSAGIRVYLDRVMQQFQASVAAASVPVPRAAPAAPVEPPIVQIRDRGLRKVYLANRAAITGLRNFLTPAAPGQDRADAKTVLATMRSVAARPGYEQFAHLPGPRTGPPPTDTALRQIASVLVGKLEAECAAIVLVDQRRQRGPPP